MYFHYNFLNIKKILFQINSITIYIHIIDRIFAMAPSLTDDQCESLMRTQTIDELQSFGVDLDLLKTINY